MTKPIYILSADFECDLGFKWEETISYFYYFETYGEAELHIPMFKDKAIRAFRNKWKLDEDDEDFNIKISIREKHLFEGE